jgi:small-conductance mechanosensitive channel
MVPEIVQNTHKRVDELKSLLKFSMYEQKQLNDSIANLQKQEQEQYVNSKEFTSKYEEWTKNADLRELLSNRSTLKTKVKALYDDTIDCHKEVLNRENKVKILGKPSSL